MRVVQDLISTSGRPPRVVCLDWAWQLQQMQQLEASPSASHLAASQARHPLTWGDVSVGDDGTLAVDRSSCPGPVRVDQLLQDVMSWSREASDEPAREEHSAPAMRSIDGDLADACQTDEDLHRATLEFATSVAHSHQKEPTAKFVFAESSLQPRRAQRSRRKEKHSQLIPTRKTMLLAGVLVAVTIVGVGSWRWLMEGRRTELELARSSPADESNALVHAGESQDLPTAELVLSSDLIRNAHVPLGLEADNEGTPSDDPLQGFALPDLREIQASPSGGPETLDSAQAKLGESVVLGTATSNEHDVLATLAEVTQQAEAEQVETELSTGVTLQAPISIPTMPMLQLLKLPASFQVRAKKPAWSLSIRTSEGFQVEPTSAQLISGRDVATWIIREKEEREFQTSILVQAQLSGNRGTSIKWRIVAGSQDLPQVALPLGQQYLDALQHNLSGFTTRLQWEIDRLKTFADSDGLASSARSAASARRRQLQSQLKLAARVLEIVAEANQLEGWLDGQLEVQAQFLDLAQEGSPPLLQFGEFPPAPTQTQTEP